MRNLSKGFVVSGAIGSVVLVALASSAAPSPDRPGQSDFLTAPVDKGDLAIEVELPGSFVAEDKDEIRIEPKSYRGELIIVQLAPEGHAVKKGDPLIAFDPKSIEDSLEEAQEEARAKEIEVQKSKAELGSWEIEATRKKTRNEVERTKARAALDKALAESEMTLVEKQRDVEQAQRRLHDAEIDLEQLMQLYH